MEEKKYTSEETLNLQAVAYQKGYNEGYELCKQERQGAVWVRCKDRLPDSWHLKCARFGSTKTFLLNPETWLKENESAIQFVEWLDESGQSKEGNNEREVAFAEWAGWEWRRVEGKNLWENQKTLEVIKSNDLHERFEKDTGNIG